MHSDFTSGFTSPDSSQFSSDSSAAHATSDACSSHPAASHQSGSDGGSCVSDPVSTNSTYQSPSYPLLSTSTHPVGTHSPGTPSVSSPHPISSNMSNAEKRADFLSFQGGAFSCAGLACISIGTSLYNMGSDPLIVTVFCTTGVTATVKGLLDGYDAVTLSAKILREGNQISYTSDVPTTATTISRISNAFKAIPKTVKTAYKQASVFCTKVEENLVYRPGDCSRMMAYAAALAVDAYGLFNHQPYTVAAGVGMAAVTVYLHEADGAGAKVLRRAVYRAVHEAVHRAVHRAVRTVIRSGKKLDSVNNQNPEPVRGQGRNAGNQTDQSAPSPK